MTFCTVRDANIGAASDHVNETDNLEFLSFFVLVIFSFSHKVESQPRPVGYVGQQVVVVGGIAVNMDALFLDQEHQVINCFLCKTRTLNFCLPCVKEAKQQIVCQFSASFIVSAINTQDTEDSIWRGGVRAIMTSQQGLHTTKPRTTHKG